MHKHKYTNLNTNDNTQPEMVMTEADDYDAPEKRKESHDENRTTEVDVTEDAAGAMHPNPPRTTTGGWFTAPKFGSAGSGGLELEPGPERD